jgi:hypothetical protein
MKLTVAICTWNRSGMLAETLNRLAQCTPPRSSDWEVVVVNNNCTDDTDATVARFRSRLPLVLVHQPIPGLSNARNAAVAAATGDFILWTDDDVLVSRDWLRAYETGIQAYPDCSIFGGPVQSYFEVEPPEWLHRNIDEFACAFALIDLGPDARPLEGDALPFGANFALRRSALQGISFDARLGRQPSAMSILGEETGVMKAMIARGATGMWLPDVTVEHRIPAARQTLKYVRDYFRGSGVTIAMTHTTPVGKRFMGYPLWMLRMSAQHWLALLMASWRRDPTWAKRLRGAWYMTGWTQGARIKGRDRTLASGVLIPARMDSSPSDLKS